MIHLVAVLVDFARNPDDAGFALSDADLAALTGGNSALAALHGISAGGGGGNRSGASSTASSPRSNEDHAQTGKADANASSSKSSSQFPTSTIQLSKQTRFPFLFQQIKDNLNLKATVTIIVAMAKWKEALADQIVQMVFKGESEIT